MIEIDDAGSGSLIGGTMIGIFRSETGEYYCELIPLKLFRHPYFMQKLYQEYVITIMERAIRRLQIRKTEPVFLCRGYIFDQLRNWLTRHGFNWQNTKIIGSLQNLVENSFNQYIISLGLPKNFLLHARYAFGFHRLFKWVMADFPERASLCKTGWKSWQKWSTTPVISLPGKAPHHEYCLRCGLIISTNEPVIVLQYETNRLWSLHLHRHCG
ncbi:MAG: hypothetical protein ACOX2X_04620 [Peptococcia bacterium]|jgi:hypothetical protein